MKIDKDRLQNYLLDIKNPLPFDSNPFLNSEILLFIDTGQFLMRG